MKWRNKKKERKEKKMVSKESSLLDITFLCKNIVERSLSSLFLSFIALFGSNGSIHNYT